VISDPATQGTIRLGLIAAFSVATLMLPARPRVSPAVELG